MTRSPSRIFRTRISRIKLKDGGAEIHILNRGARNDVEHHLREWMALIMGDPKPPDAYAAIAFYVNDDTPGRPSYNVGYVTCDHRLPTTLLLEIAGHYLRNDLIAEIAKGRTMEELGYSHDPWEPDDAA